MNIKYRRTLDVHSTGTQFVLQGFTTGDTNVREVIIGLRERGNPIYLSKSDTASAEITHPDGVAKSLEGRIVCGEVAFIIPGTEIEGIANVRVKVTTDGNTFYCPPFSIEITKI